MTTTERIAEKVVEAIRRDVPEVIESDAPIRPLLAASQLAPRLVDRIAPRIGLTEFFRRAVAARGCTESQGALHTVRHGGSSCPLGLGLIAPNAPNRSGRDGKTATQSSTRSRTTSRLDDPMTIHIGTSGWSYDHWSEVLYPFGTPSGDRLRYYTQSFQTVELNSSFCHWPRLATFQGWRRWLPDAFQFSVKAPRGLTHAKKLYAPRLG